ncbi:MAG: hypothetical protein ABEJ23_06130 [Haloarculaceae archaeon]
MAVSPRVQPRRVADVLDAARLAVDDVRVRTHLRRTERALRATDTDHLDPARRVRRERALDDLRDYRRPGAFPRNREARGRAPCFVGAEGRPCAVAHLLLADGRDDLVAAVAAADNTVRIEDLQGGPVVEWLADHGLTQAEAARIQPSYPQVVHLATTCGPVPCWLAGAVASLLGLAAFAVAEVVGYRVAGGLFPGNALKRRAALGYLTVVNLFLAPLLALLVYALFP